MFSTRPSEAHFLVRRVPVDFKESDPLPNGSDSDYQTKGGDTDDANSLSGSQKAADSKKSAAMDHWLFVYSSKFYRLLFPSASSVRLRDFHVVLQLDRGGLPGICGA